MTNYRCSEGNQLVTTLGLVGHKSLYCTFSRNLKTSFHTKFHLNCKHRPCELVDYVSYCGYLILNLKKLSKHNLQFKC